MHKELKQGQFPVRWVGDLNNGYGYPTFNYYYPGPYYLSQPFLLMGLNTIDSYKIVIIFTYILSGIFMFLWSRNYWGNCGGLVGAILYLYAPYRFISLYVNGTFGVAVSFALIPLVFWSFYLLSQKKNLKFIILGSFSLAFFLISHNATVLMFIPLFMAYLFYLIFKSPHKKNIIFRLVLSLSLSFLLAAFFLLPMIFELVYVRLKEIGVTSSYQNDFPSLEQLIYSKWGYGYSVKGLNDGMSFQLGGAQWLVMFLSLIFLSLNLKNNFKEKKLIILFIVSFFIFLFLMIDSSLFIWQLLPIIQRIEFPWKILSVETFIVAFLAGALINFLRNKFLSRLLAVFLIVLALYTNRNHLRPATFDRFNEEHFLKDPFTADTRAELMPIWSNNLPKIDPQKLTLVSGQGELKKIKATSIDYQYQAKIMTPAVIETGWLYFPNWNIYLNKKRVTWELKKEGNLSFKINPGNYFIEARLEDTIIREIGNYLSLMGIFIILFLSFTHGKIFK